MFQRNQPWSMVCAINVQSPPVLVSTLFSVPHCICIWAWRTASIPEHSTPGAVNCCFIYLHLAWLAAISLLPSVPPASICLAPSPFPSTCANFRRSCRFNRDAYILPSHAQLHLFWPCRCDSCTLTNITKIAICILSCGTCIPMHANITAAS